MCCGCSLEALFENLEGEKPHITSTPRGAQSTTSFHRRRHVAASTLYTMGTWSFFPHEGCVRGLVRNYRDEPSLDIPHTVFGVYRGHLDTAVVGMGGPERSRGWDRAGDGCGH